MRYYLAFLSLLVGSSVFAQNVRTYIPPQAAQYYPIVKEEVGRLMPEFPYMHYFSALMEHESCITLSHRRCLNAKSQLKTHREEGAGLAQLTRAYRADGSIRFDIIQELRTKFNSELKSLSWANVYERPDLQIRAMVLLSRENWNAFPRVTDQWGKLGFTDSAYNGGKGDVFKARTACGLAANCDPQKWFEHTERYNPKSTKPLYGTRSARDINNHHVHDVLIVRMPKYKPFFK